MGLREQLRDSVAALLGVSAYAQPKGYGPDLDDKIVEMVREAVGGQLQPMPTTRLRWYLADLESAQAQADAGNITMAAQLYRAMRRDGVFAGLLSTRTSGLVRLPKRFYGETDVIEELRAQNGSRSTFDEMLPPAELGLLASDGIQLGVGVGELVPVAGRSYPVLRRLEPQFLQYRWAENRWYFSSIAGVLPITPGDGRWILHLPGAAMSPWQFGLWPANGRSFINKEHAIFSRSNYSAKLANPARAAIAPIGANEPQRIGFLKKVIAWGLNTVFELPVGWDVRLIESNGRGFDVFQREIDTSDFEYMVALAGQVVTTTGGTGFANADIHKTIREDLIKSDGDALAYTINTQALPQYMLVHHGVDAIGKTIVEWDTNTPKELQAQAQTMLTLSQAIVNLGNVLAGTDRRLNIDELMSRFGVPFSSGQNDEPGVIDSPQPELSPSDALKQPTTRAAIAAIQRALPPIARRMSVEQLARTIREAA